MQCSRVFCVWHQAVYSSELAERKLAPLDTSAPAHELGTMDNFRVRVLPVLGPLPAIFGNAMAAFVLCALAGQPFQYDIHCIVLFCRQRVLIFCCPAPVRCQRFGSQGRFSHCGRI